MKKLLLVSFLLTACGNEPSPVLVGTIDANAVRQALTVASKKVVKTDLQIQINGEEREIDIDQSNAFAIQDLPTGTLHFQVAVDGITGTLEIEDVLPGEVIEIGVVAAPGLLELRVVRRDVPPPESEPVDLSNGLEINGRHIVHHLEPGLIEGDVVIHGEQITLISPDYYGCRAGGRAVVLGDLIIHGRKVRVVNLEVEGRTVIRGDHVKVYEPCRRRYDDD